MRIGRLLINKHTGRKATIVNIEQVKALGTHITVYILSDHDGTARWRIEDLWKYWNQRGDEEE